jgi:hypothetical protein
MGERLLDFEVRLCVRDPVADGRLTQETAPADIFVYFPGRHGGDALSPFLWPPGVRSRYRKASNG